MFALIFTLVVGLLIGRYLIGRKSATQVSGTGDGTSAFAKLASADGKLIALKVATESKKAEAEAAHVAIDEVHELLG